ncbi:trehalose-phosphatase [Saccharopolyspora taberi]|uniref:Trehalose 6-phosphate phosphatase n=1 Tax=Saccharopolyspora taberi TaxID=60895 RepID=A0ABN3V9J4_9PSEU
MAAADIDPDRHRAVLLALDGVLADTAAVHSAAWKRLFDQYLANREEDQRPFDADDYARYVDDRPRAEGVIDFLRSRGIELPRGTPDDRTGQDTALGLGKLKEHYFRDALAAGGVRVTDGAVELLDALRGRNVRTAVLSASRNCALVLDHANLTDRFDARVDGIVADELGLPGVPDPATRLEAARRLGVAPAEAVAVEGSAAGVEAAERGGFGMVVGVAVGRAPVVVDALRRITVAGAEPGSHPLPEIPDALEHWNEFAARLRAGRPVLLLDFDGTLAPIQDTPDRVRLPWGTRRVLQELSEVCPVAVISGRDLDDVRQRVRVHGLWYGGSHGFEIAGPDDEYFAHPAGEAALPGLDEAQQRLSAELESVPGVLIDRKRFALAVHYRLVHPDSVSHVVSVVHEIGSGLPSLRTAPGRLVAELLPDVDWDKGHALRWLLDHLAVPDPLPLYAGDDFTDEAALRAVRDSGVGVVVRSTEHGDRATWAHYAVEDTHSVSALLGRVASLLRTVGGHP